MLYDVCMKIELLNSENEVTIIDETHSVFKKGDITIARIGNVFDKYGNMMKLDEIYKTYKKYGEKICEYIDGIYNLVIVDKTIKRAFIFHDAFGGGNYMYYYNDGRKVIISTTIKGIIRTEKEATWEINEYAAEQFIEKGYITGNNTLIYDIYKTVPGKYTAVNLKNGFISDKKISKGKIGKSRNISANEYDKILRQSVIDNVKGKAAVELSSDFNSNYVLHHISYNLPNGKEANAYSVTHPNDAKESAKIDAICKEYENVTSISQVTRNSILNAFPKIVYITEGAVFTPDIFAKYELAKLISDNGQKTIVLTDDAKSIFNSQYYNKKDDLIKNAMLLYKDIKSRFVAVPDEVPFKSESEKLYYETLPKTDILLNYFGVAPFHPYLMKDITSIAENSVKFYSKGSIQEKSAKSNISTGVLRYLRNSPDALDLKTLFSNDISQKQILDIAKKSQYMTMFPREYPEASEKAEYVLRIVYLELFRRIFTGKLSEQFIEKGEFNYSLKAFFPKILK